MNAAKISELLENINRKANKTDFATISKIEVDLLMHQLREVYAALDEFRNTIDTNEQPPVVKTEVRATKRILNPNQNILLEEPAPQTLAEEVKAAIQIIEAPAVTDNTAVAEITQEAKLPIKQPEKQLTSEQAPINKVSINDSVQTVASINEKLKTPQQEVHRKLATKPLKDLIDLNKKFVLQNELFKGNSEALSAAIQHIDQLQNFEEAAAYVMNELSAKNQWNLTSQPAKLFAQLVKQKFGVE